ncbi:TAXI family TRAP transporter solute-binding subunit [Caenimonas sp. SL110]|uniref:TAXI family TRAP transporter solute-binding subunit n=1 Tax=Caenimonas sp. SL110 TaxID=1450524 RepID=UPI000652D7F0|nr:TAXI family TRAP transporter solute-binding subunit [Caenimonas sp. SL110]
MPASPAARIYRSKWLLVKAPLALAALAIIAWLWITFLPMPPREVTMSSGLAEGVYNAYAQKYAQVFERHGVTLKVVTSEGADSNLQRLRGVASPTVDLAFVQGGMGSPSTDRSQGVRLETLARVDNETVWLFSRVPGLDSLEQLQGLRVSLGPRGSGTRRLATALLEQVRMGVRDIVDLETSGPAAIQAMANGSLDAMFMVSAPQSQVVNQLLRTPGVQLVQLKRSAALTERLPFLQLRLLPEGALDPLAKIPARDTAVLIATSSLVARADLHPALQRLAAEVAQEVHAGAGPFHRASDFPTLKRIEFPASAQARYTLVHGRPWFEKSLPFWWGQLLLRLLVIVLPVTLAAFWLARVIPAYLRWLVDSRVARWYGELKFIEHDLARSGLSGVERVKYLQRLAEIEKQMAEFATPSYLMPRWYTLRKHIDFVRSGLYSGRGR